MSRETIPPEELQNQDHPQQPRVSFEAMRNSLLALHTPDSVVGQEVERAYEEACEGKLEYLVELYEKQQEQLEHYAEDELAFFGNILDFISGHWSQYFHQQDVTFEEYDAFLQPLFEACQGRFADLVDVHTALLALGSTGKSNIFVKQKLQMLVGKIAAFHESTDEDKDAQLFLTDLRLKLHEVIKDVQDAGPQKKNRTTEEDLTEYYDSDDIGDDEVADTASQKITTTTDSRTVLGPEDAAGVITLTAVREEDTRDTNPDSMTRVTEDEEQVLLWKKMIQYGFFRGLIHEQQAGVYTLSLTDQILPWCGIPPEEFFEKNRRYHDLFPRALAEIINPRTGEHFPEAVFLDESGYALRYFLQDRWEEYLRTPQYRTYYYEFVDEQVPFAA